MPDIRAPTVAQAIFDNWVCRYGVMPRLHSDGAKNVDGEVMRLLCILMGIKKSKSSRLHTEGDGILEAGDISRLSQLYKSLLMNLVATGTYIYNQQLSRCDLASIMVPE